MDELYFSKWISFKNDRIPKCVAQTKRPPANIRYRAQYIFDIFVQRYELLIEKYSRGDDVEELRPMLPELIEAWEWARREELKVFNEEEMHRRHGFDVNLDAYNLALWLVSIFICLQAEAPLLARLIALIGNEGQDQLYERLIATQVQGRKQAQALLHPKPYALLYEAIDEPVKADRDKLLLKFMKAWYPSMHRTYWHDSHKGKDGGGYFGYWCFEAAGVVRAFGIDDTVIRDDPYYPKDMAAFGTVVA